MKLLVVGGGAREHALVWKLSSSPKVQEVYYWPGNPAMEGAGLRLDLPTNATHSQLAEKIKNLGIEFVVVGPEGPLADGLADHLVSKSILCFGPKKEGALLESSKAFAKQIMAEADIPTARYKVTHDESSCRSAALEEFKKSGGVVLKASGLAAGKGVFVCKSMQDIEDGLFRLFRSSMKDAANEIVVEELLSGKECSYFTLLGKHAPIELGFAVDFKRLLEQDAGPNTGGMGCYTPVPWLPDDAGFQVEQQIVSPLVQILKQKNISYTGFLYVGLMWTDGGPKVIEFNVRLGDPEAQILAVADKRDWAELIAYQVGFSDSFTNNDAPFQPTIGVVIASNNYPYGEDELQRFRISKSYFRKGFENSEGSICFGAALSGCSQAVLENKSGRNFTVVSRGESFGAARKNVYQLISSISGLKDHARWREDIALEVSEAES